LAKRIGALLIPTFFIFSTSLNAFGQDSTLQVEHLKILAQQFKHTEQPFLSYSYNLAYYHLVNDSTEKLNAGFDAFRTAISSQRFDEAKLVIGLLSSRFPDLKSYLQYYFGYALIRNQQFGEGDRFIREAGNLPDSREQSRFLRAYTKLAYFNDPNGSLELVSQIDRSSFPFSDTLTAIKTELASEPKGAKKYQSIAVPLSIILPGSGQFYAGFHFDALQSFGFNLLTGYATYVSWRHELDQDRGDRNYVMPIISSFVSSLFYLSNIFSTVNAVNKANLYRLDQHYRGILQKFQFVLSQEAYFFKVQLPF